MKQEQTCGASSMHWEMRNSHKILVGERKGKKHFGDLDVDGRID
jgi:hypothetical protein